MSIKKTYFILFITILAAYAYFFQGIGGWGTTVRFDFVYAVVEDGTTHIDAYQENTGDKAFFNGHYYLDKPVGSVLLAIPMYNLIKGVAWLAHVNLPRNPNNSEVTSVITILSVSLVSALMAVFFFHFLSYFSSDISKRLWMTLTYALGTLVFPYSTVFHGHQVSAAVLFVSFFLLMTMRLSNSDSVKQVFVSGLLAAYGVITEMQTIVIYAGIVIYLYSILHDKRKTLFFLIASSIPLSVFLFFNYLFFGHPFRLGYSYHSTFADITKHGLLGISSFDVKRLGYLTFSWYRGIFVFSPVLLLSFPAYYEFYMKREWRPEFWLSVYIIIVYFVLISSYPGWYGGWTFGPRYLIPIIPFLTFPILFLLERDHKFYFIFRILALASIACMILGTAVNPEVIPDDVANPIRDFCLPAFLEGSISPNAGFMLLNLWPQLKMSIFFPLVTLIPLVVFLPIIYFYIRHRFTRYN